MSLYMLLAETATEAAGLEQAAENAKEKVNYAIRCWEAVWPGIRDFGIKLIGALILFIVGRLLIRFMLGFMKKFFDKTNMEISVSKFLMSLLKVVLYVILLVMVCARIGIETSSFIAIIGSVGLAVGLSLQGSLSNFAGGVLILIVKPFKVGDYIIDGGSGKEGTVTKIDIFYTNLVTLDNKKIVIPNGAVANSTLVNVTAYDKRRVDFEIGISYESDISMAKEVIAQTAAKCPFVIQDEEIFAFVSNLDTNQVTLGLRVWAKTEDYWTVKFELTEEIKKAFDENGIEIPYSQLQVHMN